jgi:hypothetical protein
MGTGHLRGEEPWFYVGADTTLHLQVVACPDGYVIGENAANARLIAAAPDLLDVLLRAKDIIEALDGTSTENEKLVDDYRAVLAKVEGTK